MDIEYRMDRGRWVVRFYIDKEGGVTLDDCSEVSGEVGAILDVKDIIPHSYDLEVSSPGLDRPLVKERDFLRHRGEKVRIKTKTAIDGRRNFSVILEDVKEGKVIVKDDQGKSWEIPLAEIEKARLVI
ncbi:MAG: ribosome maturation factor RimP [Deltaproteobacteria bacterium]|nr:ribosome maturation factor RimP [Deltaproteobacteria bacterium]